MPKALSSEDFEILRTTKIPMDGDGCYDFDKFQRALRGVPSARNLSKPLVRLSALTGCDGSTVLTVTLLEKK